MIPRLQTIWENVRSSLWALPLAMMAAAVAAAIVALGIRIDPGDDPVWFLYSGGAAGAPQFLSNLVSSLITMATLAISITMVVLALAAQQLGPRLIRSFMGDRRTQLSLGFFLATVVYLLLVLRSVYGDAERIPNLAVTIGTALVLSSLIVLLLFVHHLARSIIADNVIERVGNELDARIESLLEPLDQAAPGISNSRPVKTNAASGGVPVTFTESGYVQIIDYSQIGAHAAKHDAVVELRCRAGQHAVAGTIAGWVTPPEAATDEFALKLNSAIVLGSERTAVQDMEFSIRHLVEIALRALSSGINDPYTSIAVIDRLTVSLRKMMERKPPATSWRDDNGVARLHFPSSTFEGIADTAFHQIRQQGADQPGVLVRLAENYVKLHALADAEQQRVLEKHIRLVVETARRTIPQPEDLQDVEAAGAIASLSRQRRKR